MSSPTVLPKMARSTVRREKEREVEKRLQRERLTPTALKVAHGILVAWGLSEPLQTRLIAGDGGMTVTTYRSKVAQAEAGRGPLPLPDDVLQRCSLLLQIEQHLLGLYGERYAHDWITRVNDHAEFSGHTPLEVMLARGFGGLLTVRDHLLGRTL